VTALEKLLREAWDAGFDDGSNVGGLADIPRSTLFEGCMENIIEGLQNDSSEVENQIGASSINAELVEAAENLVDLHMRALSRDIAEPVEWDSAIFRLRHLIAKARGETR